MPTSSLARLPTGGGDEDNGEGGGDTLERALPS